jgi:hypothetical protein
MPPLAKTTITLRTNLLFGPRPEGEMMTHLSSLETEAPDEAFDGIRGMYAPRDDVEHDEQGRPQHGPDHHHHRPREREKTDHHARPHEHETVGAPRDATGHHHRPFDKGAEREGNPILAAIHKSARGDARIEKTMRNIYGGESSHGANWDLGDHGESGGPFQLDTAGGRLGAQFEKTHPGMSVHDPKTLQAQSDFVAGWLRDHPHADPSNVWFGLRHPERFGNLKGGYAPSTGGNGATPREGDIAGKAQPLEVIHGTTQGVDKGLLNAVAAGAKHLPPGYKVKVFSGYRPGDPGAHGRGQAIDVEIVDPRGNVIPSRGEYTTGMYRRLAVHTHNEMRAVDPYRAEHGLAWGGSFGTQKGGGGVSDLMHFDVMGRRGGVHASHYPQVQQLGGVPHSPQPHAKPVKTDIAKKTFMPPHAKQAAFHPIAGKVSDFDGGFDAFVEESMKKQKTNPTTPWGGAHGSTPSVPSPKSTTTWGKHFPDEFIRDSGVRYDRDPGMPVIRDDPKGTAREKAEYERIQRYIDAMRARKTPS